MNKRILLQFLLVIAITVTGCSKHEEEIYSCNEDANLWAKSNLDEIKQMKVAEWHSINNIVYQRAAFVAFNVDQRKELWLSKLQETLELNWTNTEKEHIENLVCLIKDNPQIFDDKVGVEDDTELMLHQWKEYALEQLKWDNELIFAIIKTPEKLNVNKKLNINLPKSPIVKNQSESDTDKQPLCNCNSYESHKWFLCTLWFHQCHVGVCEVRTYGCGDLWAYGCNGMCV